MSKQSELEDNYYFIDGELTALILRAVVPLGAGLSVKNIQDRDAVTQSLLDWHNKQTLELLDGLIAQQWSFGENDDALAVPTRYIKAECNKLKESTDGN